MSLIFWKSREKTGEDAEHGPAIEVSENHPLPVNIYFKRSGSEETEEVSEGYPVPVYTPEDQKVGIKTSTTRVGPFQLVGVVPAAIYADLDALGTVTTIDVPKSGIIQQAVFYDLDDEGLQVDLWLFRDSIAAPTDNSAFAPSDADIVKTIDVIQFTGFRDGNTGQVSIQRGLGLSYVADKSKLWVVCQSRGTPTIADGSIPQFSLTILPDS